jgi:NADH pyrophosphatase NudC (nudix superfamily)
MSESEPEGEVPGTIRVRVRQGKDDWIGIAYSSQPCNPDTIRQYRRVETCVWNKRNDWYTTACGVKGIRRNDVHKFCGFCGGKLEVGSDG